MFLEATKNFEFQQKNKTQNTIWKPSGITERTDLSLQTFRINFHLGDNPFKNVLKSQLELMPPVFLPPDFVFTNNQEADQND